MEKQEKYPTGDRSYSIMMSRRGNLSQECGAGRAGRIRGFVPQRKKKVDEYDGSMGEVVVSFAGDVNALVSEGGVCGGAYGSDGMEFAGHLVVTNSLAVTALSVSIDDEGFLKTAGRVEDNEAAVKPAPLCLRSTRSQAVSY